MPKSDESVILTYPKMTKMSLFGTLRLVKGVDMKRKMMERLVKWKQENIRKPLILKGVRQTGKTHLLKEFGRRHFDQIHYFNFEKEPGLSKVFAQDLVPKRILSELSFYSDCPINVGRDLVVFDEI